MVTTEMTNVEISFMEDCATLVGQTLRMQQPKLQRMPNQR